jgi:hypothetical protein
MKGERIMKQRVDQKFEKPGVSGRERDEITPLTAAKFMLPRSGYEPCALFGEKIAESDGVSRCGDAKGSFKVTLYRASNDVHAARVEFSGLANGGSAWSDSCIGDAHVVEGWLISLVNPSQAGSDQSHFDTVIAGSHHDLSAHHRQQLTGQLDQIYENCGSFFRAATERRSMQRGMLDRYYYLLDAGRAELPAFTFEEASLMAWAIQLSDSFGEKADVRAATAVSTIASEIFENNGADHFRCDGDQLLRKLADLTPTALVALVEACERFWRYYPAGDAEGALRKVGLIKSTAAAIGVKTDKPGAPKRRTS